MTEDLPQQRREGAVLQAALQTDGRSIRQVAPLANVSEARWRQIVKGSMTSNGHTVEVVAPPATLARMAYVLSLEPKHLAKAGREDAAEVLASLQREAQRGTSVVPLLARPAAGGVDEIEMIDASTTMTTREKLQAIRIVLRLHAQAEAERRGDTQEVPAQDAGAEVEQT